MQLDPFQRAAVIALAWCLIGLGIDTQPNRARRNSVDQDSHFASMRLRADAPPSKNALNQIKPR
jgi:hypothetical protein